MVIALVDAANDKDKSVTEMVRSSLYAIGLEKPELVLSLCKDYISKHQKVFVLVSNSISTLSVCHACMVRAGL
jgi:hypothetical protein